jgi:tetraprenyl-beta-curcumene synthase
VWGLNAASHELREWRARAQQIPDAPLRADALYVLEHKRPAAYGAALFWTLPGRRDRNLLRLLVAYELIWDFLDSASERAAHAGIANGRQLHLAVREAVDPDTPVSDYYLHHPWRDDGGYLRALVETCRDGCRALPSYPLVRGLVVHEARRAVVQAINHHPDPVERDLELRRWVAGEYAEDGKEASWWELSGAASAPLVIHALLALASDPRCSERDAARVHAAYCPWLGATTTMLDSYVDQPEDVRAGNHSYVAHYPDADSALHRIQTLIQTSVVEARALRNGHRHAVIAAAMIAMYLSKDTARTPQLRGSTSSLVSAGGSLTRLLLPILRVWRIAFALRSA